LYFAEEMENGGSKGDVPEDANARKQPLLPMGVDYYHMFPFSLVLGQIWSSMFSCFLGRLAMKEWDILSLIVVWLLCRLPWNAVGGGGEGGFLRRMS
jgi:hypothetical protein